MKSFAIFAVLFFTTLACSPATAPQAAEAPAPAKLDAAALRTSLAQLERGVAEARLHDDTARWAALLTTADTLAQQTADPRVRRVRATALLALGRAKEARVDADALAAADANDVVAAGLVADAALAMGDLDVCEAALERMMALAPGLPVYARAAELRFRTGNVDNSLKL